MEGAIVPKTVVNNRTRQVEMKTLKYGWLGCLTLAGILGTLTAAGGAEVVAAKPDAKGVEFFEKHIRPVLTQQCYKCHAQDATKVKGGLVLELRNHLGGQLLARGHFEIFMLQRADDKAFCDFTGHDRMPCITTTQSAFARVEH